MLYAIVAIESILLLSLGFYVFSQIDEIKQILKDNKLERKKSILG